jgi:outer membrane immunogenic protein
MKRVLLAAAGLSILGSGTVIAADIAPYRAPVPVAAPVAYDWTGLYFGGHIGGGWEKTWSNDDGWVVLGGVGAGGAPNSGPGSMNSTSSSFLGGVQAGYNYQIGRFVLGSEFDWSWTSLNNRSTGGMPVIPPVAGTFNTETFGASNNWTATATTRLGVTRDTWMFYGKAGAAWTGATYTLGALQVAAAGNAAFGGTLSETHVGWTVGTGVEWAFAPSWTAKLEYDYLDFGSWPEVIAVGGRTGAGAAFGANVNANVHQSISELKFGVNYKMAPGFLFW